jgi:hypothetical protein
MVMAKVQETGLWRHESVEGSGVYMRTLYTSALAAATLALAASVAAPAAAVNFQGSYSIDANQGNEADGNGLFVNTQKLNPQNLNFDLDYVGDTYTRNLFLIWTEESTVNVGEDDVAAPITVNFAFTVPEVFGGPLNGETNGSSTWGGFLGLFNTQTGEVTWENPAVLAFNGGQLQIDLSNVNFNSHTSFLGLGGLEDGKHAKKYGAKVEATFTLLDPVQNPGGAVPEPATWAMMITGFGFAGAMLRQQRRRLAA